jgi:TonB family protein
MIFCLEDGTPLVGVVGKTFDAGETIRIPAPRVTNQAPTEILLDKEAAAAAAIIATPAPPKRDVAEAALAQPPPRKQNPMLWIIGAALILGLSGIAIAWIMTSNRDSDNSQIAQNNVQPENSSVVTDSNSTSSNRDNPIPGQTPESRNASATASSQTSGQAMPTPKLTPTPTPRATPTPRPEPTPEPTRPEPTPPPRPRAPISGGVLNGKATSLPKPAYPAIARAARASGTVTVQVTVDESGKVISARAVGGHPLLQQSAVQAAYGARFSPTQLSGQPVKVTGVITYNFVAQ